MTYQTESVSLYVRSGARDAVYFIQLTESDAGWNVRGQYGRRGSTLSLSEIATNLSYEQAKKAFDKKLKSKLTENPPYRYMDGKPDPTAGEDVTDLVAPERMTVGRPQPSEVLFSCELLLRLETSQALPYAKRDRFWFQTKRDDRRLTAVLRNGETFGLNKKGERIQIDAKLSAAIQRIAQAGKVASLMLDGEIESTGYWCWDILDLNGEQIRELAYSDRYEILKSLLEHPRCFDEGKQLLFVVETAKTTTEKLTLWQRLEKARAEGFVIKDSTARYRPGRNGQHLKVKFETFGSVIVGKKPKEDGHRSVAMYCYVGAMKFRFMGTVGVPDKYPLPAEGQIIDVRYLYRHHGTDGKLMQAKYFGKVRDDVRQEECIPEQFRLKQTAEEAAA